MAKEGSNKPQSPMIHTGERYINPLTDDIAEIAKFNTRERRAYEMSVNAYRDIKNGMDTAKKEGLAEGIAKGREEGLAEGRAEGLAEGRAEVARTMISMNVPINDIMKYTGLSEEEIESLTN